MNVIKETCNDRCVIRTKTYANNLQHFIELFEEAKKDFPQLEPGSVEIVQYGGQDIKRMFGIEFNIKGEKPTTYRKIPYLENHL